MTTFVETPKGVCVVSAINGEYTVCGDAFDLASHEPDYAWKPTKRRRVTCPDCKVEVLNLRSAQVSRESL